MKIVTGYAGEMHITSNDDQGLNQGLLGVGNYILSVGSQFAANMVSANELQIADGEGVLQGVHFRVEPETTDSVTIENGSQGMQRIDLVCAQYTKDAQTGVESMEWVVIKGEEAASDPVEPSYTAGDVLGGDVLAQFPVYSVTLDGITVDSVTLLAQMLSTQAETDASISSLSGSLDYNTRKDTGWMAACGFWDLDDMNTQAACGTWWLNLASGSGITGTKPTGDGQGILFVLRQSETIYRQTYIGLTQNQKIWNRYYTTTTNVWSSWTEYWSN